MVGHQGIEQHQISEVANDVKALTTCANAVRKELKYIVYCKQVFAQSRDEIFEMGTGGTTTNDTGNDTTNNTNGTANSTVSSILPNINNSDDPYLCSSNASTSTQLIESLFKEIIFPQAEESNNLSPPSTSSAENIKGGLTANEWFEGLRGKIFGQDGDNDGNGNSSSKLEKISNKSALKKIRVHFIRHGEGHHNVVQREWRKKKDWDGYSEPYFLL